MGGLRVRRLDRRCRLSPRPGRDLVVDTARYWASRITVDEDGRGHLAGVMGPDEYHEAVDDNAFTNVMARWNLRRGAQLIESGTDTSRRAVAPPGRQPRRWLGSGSAPLSAVRWLLGSRNAAGRSSRTTPCRRRRIARRQPGQGLAADQASRRPDAAPSHPRRRGTRFACRQPRLLRTPHGSRQFFVARGSRQPARPGGPPRVGTRVVPSGRSPRPRRPHRHDCRGLHLATMGGIWQALAYGFLGLRPGTAGSRSIRAFPDRGLRSNSACGSAATRSACTPTTTRSPSAVASPWWYASPATPIDLFATGADIHPGKGPYMKTVLAALDSSPAARPVLETSAVALEI